MGRLLVVFIVIFILLIAIGLYLKFPLIPILLIGSLIACITSFAVFGFLGRDTEQKQVELLEKEKRFFKGTTKNS